MTDIQIYLLAINIVSNWRTVGFVGYIPINIYPQYCHFNYHCLMGNNVYHISVSGENQAYIKSSITPFYRWQFHHHAASYI